MAQTLITYLIVATAAGWTAWSLLLRGWVARRRSARSIPRPSAEKTPASCGPDCSCGS